MVGLPTPLYKAGVRVPLYEYVERALKQRTLLDYVEK
jgi:hypothetical protein